MEIWKDIGVIKWINFTWIYKISNTWKVKSLERFIVMNWWKFLKKELILKWCKQKIWYLTVDLCNKGIYKKVLIHRLVWLAFISNPENKLEINHINWVKDDNRVENLEWCTHKENLQHSWDIWLQTIWNNHNWINNHPIKWKFWKDHKDSKKVNQYTLDLEFIKTWDSMADVERELWFRWSNIAWCCKWNYWRKSVWWYKWQYV